MPAVRDTVMYYAQAGGAAAIERDELPAAKARARKKERCRSLIKKRTDTPSRSENEKLYRHITKHINESEQWQRPTLRIIYPSLYRAHHEVWTSSSGASVAAGRAWLGPSWTARERPSGQALGWTRSCRPIVDVAEEKLLFILPILGRPWRPAHWVIRLFMFRFSVALRADRASDQAFT